LLAEVLDTDRRQNVDDRGISPLSGHPLGRAPQSPAEYRKADDRYGNRSSCRAPKFRCQASMILHEFGCGCLGILGIASGSLWGGTTGLLPRKITSSSLLAG